MNDRWCPLCQGAKSPGDTICLACKIARQADQDDLGEDDQECEGHPAGPYDPMGVTVYCDGSCR